MFKIIMIFFLSIVTIFPDKGQTKALPDEAGAVYLSLNQGKNWRRADKGLPAGVTVTAFANNGNMVVAGTQKQGIFISTDQLKSWQSVNTGLPADVRIKSVHIFKNSIFIGTFEHGIFVSIDQGGMWFPSSRGIENSPIQCFQAVGAHLLVGTDVGVYRSSDNGRTWIQTFKNHQVNGFTTIGDHTYAAIHGGIITSSDGGKNWKYIFDKTAVHDLATDGTHLYALTYTQGVLKMEDEGKRWLKYDTGLAPGHYTYQIKKVGNRLLAGQWDQLYKSDTQGLTWELMVTGLPKMAYPEWLVTDFGVIVSTATLIEEGC